MISMKSLALAFVLATPAPFAITAEGESQQHSPDTGNDSGQPDMTGEVDRTVEITLHDIYYDPASVEVESGETVGFVLSNEGELLHEFHIGTGRGDEEHEAKIQKML